MSRTSSPLDILHERARSRDVWIELHVDTTEKRPDALALSNSARETLATEQINGCSGIDAAARRLLAADW